MRATRTLAACAAVTAALFAASSVVTGVTAASSPPIIASPNGIVGVPQIIDLRAPQLTGQILTLSIANDGGPVGILTVNVNDSGSGNTTWTPPSAGQWRISGLGALAPASASVINVAATPTTTTLYSANKTQVNAATTMIAAVQALTGNIAPTGSVTFSLATGTPLQTVPLRPSIDSISLAYFSWQPSTTGTTTIIATYNPTTTSGAQANMTPSESSNTIETVDTNPLVTLRLPSSYTIGTRVDVTSVINDIGLQGSASFSTNINGNIVPISGSIPLEGSSSTIRWTPTLGGNQILTTRFSASNSNASGSSQQWIYVEPALPTDTISTGFTPEDWWPTNDAITIATDDRVPFITSTASGAPVTTHVTAPCLVNGAELLTPTSPATCTMTVTSPGTSTSAAGDVSYTLSVKASAPKRRR